ncbi:MAG: hypothetical protein RMZ43_003530 [Nostoc sp. CmiVER01]|uniref:hypothetical protein n=1 Tax=Nostoc sp. CmiVER01 TaxID=3075384 RepID=UPI002AD3E0BB|nr:hypothetical protein [Nostoc sp. CmiVER01]MDZ8124641.1 hypothetical protein [Nostoc sp. CmiVER01]
MKLKLDEYRTLLRRSKRIYAVGAASHREGFTLRYRQLENHPYTVFLPVSGRQHLLRLMLPVLFIIHLIYRSYTDPIV